MKAYTHFIVLTLVIFSNCRSSNLYSKRKYDDQLLSKSDKINGLYTKKFIRHGLIYIDKISGKKLVERNVYQNEKLLYRYPMNQSTLGKTEIKLLSGNSYLKRNFIDTVAIINNNLPTMNRHVWVKGAMISWLSDSSYLIKVKDTINRSATVYVSVSHNYEGVSGDSGFISDSLMLPIK